MVRVGRIVSNPLQNVVKVEQRGREVRKPRPLLDDEVSALLSVASRWRVVYLAAVLTGLSRKELRKLLWSDVHLDEPHPFIDAPASTTKNKKRAVISCRSGGGVT